MILASSIRIVEQTSRDLVILCTPHYFRGGLLTLACVFSLLGAIIYTIHRYDYARSVFRNLLVLFIAFFLAAPLGVAASDNLSGARLTFSVQSGMMILNRAHCGMAGDSYSIPLDNIDHVTIRPNGSDEYALRFVMSSGHSFVITGRMPADAPAKINTALHSFITAKSRSI